MSRFKINQKVVCVKSHSEGAVKKGLNYTVRGHSCCGGVDVGVNQGYMSNACPDCKKRTGWHKCWYISENLFAPLKEDGSTAELNLCIEEFELEIIEYN